MRAPFKTSRASAVTGNPASAPVAGGFSLLELLVVLAIIALIGALTLPNLGRLYDSASRSTERSRIMDQLGTVADMARRHRQDYAVIGSTASSEALPDGFSPYPLELADGWAVTVEAPILVRSTGFCGGGRVTVSHTESPPRTVDLAPPLCRVGDVW